MDARHLISATLILLLAQPAGATARELGRVTYNAVCSACHAPENVMVNSPKAGDVAEWRRRLAKGLESAAANAINGIGAMPPKGGAPELSTEQIRQAILYMAKSASDEANKAAPGV